MKTTTLLPSIRSCVGDWNYYVTTLTFGEVSKLISAPDEIHERKRLGDWIQREAIESHADAVADYLVNNPQRFLGSLIIGVYGGAPNWTPVDVNMKGHSELTEEQVERIEGCLGLLHFSGDEKLFAIDGQHRVAGIKLALSKTESEILEEDCVSAIFVAHDPSSDAGKQRTRRLFTTVNKRAKVISKASKIALDEDDGFAVVTRQLIDRHWLFADESKHILFDSGGSISTSDVLSITSVVGLFEIVKDLYGGKKSFDQGRPSDDDLKTHLDLCVEFFNELITQVPEFKLVFSDAKGYPGDYRTREKNHLLFRPIGQRAFARATQLLLSRHDSLKTAICKLKDVEMDLHSAVWHHILWDPVTETMITNKAILAEAQILKQIGAPFRNIPSEKKLNSLLNLVAKRG
jgi:DNA sulfur modification protein DndB